MTIFLHLATGFSLSMTSMMKLQPALFPELSLVCIKTLLVPELSMILYKSAPLGISVSVSIVAPETDKENDASEYLRVTDSLLTLSVVWPALISPQGFIHFHSFLE